MNMKILLVVVLFAMQSANAKSEYRCDDNPKIIELKEIAVSQTEGLLSELASYFEKPEVVASKKLRRRLKSIKRRLECISRRVPKLAYICKDKKFCGRGSASVFFPKLRTVNLCPKIYGDKKYPSYKNRAAVIVHEASHTCGTLDCEYGRHPRKGDFGVFGSSANADNFEYWAKKGFCLPGFDCKENAKGYNPLKKSANNVASPMLMKMMKR